MENVSSAMFLDQVPSAIIATDLGGNVLVWNAGAERLYGYAAAEITGQHISKLYFPEDVYTLESAVFAPLRTNDYAVARLRNRTAMGGEITIALRVAPLRSPTGDRVGYVGCSWDMGTGAVNEEVAGRSRIELESAIQARTQELANAVHRLSIEISERQRAEAGLRFSEARVRQLLATAPVVLYTALNTDPSHITFVSDSISRLFGLDAADLMNWKHKWTDFVHPGDRAALRELWKCVAEEGEASAEYRVHLPDRGLRWIRDVATLIRNGNAKPFGIVGFWSDVSDARRAADAFQTRERQKYATEVLVNALELERKRIARDLHDNLNQTLGLVILDVAAAERKTPPTLDSVRRTLVSIRRQLSDLSDQLRSVAHQLHSATLDQLGLRAALQHECSSLAKRLGVPVDFVCDGACPDLPEPVALCVYRVVQESLRNIAQHSHANRAVVSLKREPGGVQLRVQDSGIGFAPRQTGAHAGLGLISMEERVRLLDGTFTVESVPGGGTTVIAFLPLEKVKGGL